MLVFDFTLWELPPLPSNLTLKVTTLPTSFNF